MQRKKWIYILVSAVAMSSIYAAPYKKTILKNPAQVLRFLKTPEKHWFFAPALGMNEVRLDQTMNVPNGSNFAAPMDMDAYTTTSKYHTSASLTWGYLWQNNNKWFPAYALGIRYQHIFGDNAGENVIQYSLPQFTSYRYLLNISADVFQAIAKINVVRWNQWSPYISTGVGISFNRAEDFSETAYPDVDARDTPGYANRLTTQLAYSLGFGCDYILRKNLILNIGYEYEHLGRVSSGYGVGTWAGEQLRSNTLQSRALMLGFTDLIG